MTTTIIPTPFHPHTSNKTNAQDEIDMNDRAIKWGAMELSECGNFTATVESAVVVLDDVDNINDNHDDDDNNELFSLFILQIPPCYSRNELLHFN